MTNEINTGTALSATYVMQSMTTTEFDGLLISAFNYEQPSGNKLNGDFYSVELLNSPLGVIVFAYHGHEGCDAFYPASIDFQNVTGIEPWMDDIEPVNGDVDSKFVRHHLGRKTSGFLVSGAFGYMISAGDEAAPFFDWKFRTLEYFDSPAGLIVVAIKGKQVRAVIPATLAVSTKEAA